MFMVKKTVVLEQSAVSRLIHKLWYLTGSSQEQVAEMLGGAFSTIHRWGNGHMQPSSLAIKHPIMMLRKLNLAPNAQMQAQYFSDVESHV